MAQKETFYDQQPIDRTPYTSCVWVSVLALIVFLTGMILLWRAAGVIKRHLPHTSLNQSQSSDTLNSAANSVRAAADAQAQQIQQGLQDELQKQKDAAAQAAIDAAKNAAKQAVDQQVQQLTK